ncbi:hypothetical protein [Sutcliffiella horikoshii]|uniref:Uncharacterized protein n=1 Tax=Sutcliffiella horikoshii TaxID=79883 RepID=A0A5D4SIP8_9BACI|nr:hypothetical protein [Sutcliffiella horikoshii]TYS63547.1 hypothetical protein FZC75_21135 [Sutcliffiella horikoshii]
MKETDTDIITDLDMIHEDLIYAMENAKNPKNKTRIKQIKGLVLSLKNDIEHANREQQKQVTQVKQNDSNRARPVNKKHPIKKEKIIHYGSPGRNAIRINRCFNTAGVFMPNAWKQKKRKKSQRYK